TYFLGAIVPLLALGFVVQRDVLPGMSDAPRAQAGMIGVVLGVGMLSLTAFFALRKLTRQAVQRMDADNDRLKEILAASQELSKSPHTRAVAESAAGCVLTVTGTQAAFVALRSAPEKPLTLMGSAGEGAQALYESNQDLLDELFGNAVESDRPVFLGDDDSRAGSKLRAAALPLRGEEGHWGAIAVLDTAGAGAFKPEEMDAIATLAALTSVAFSNADLKDAQRNFFSHVIDLIVTALDAHVDCRAGHSEAVARLSNRIGRELGLDDAQLQRLHFAALLHDIGMLKIDRAEHRMPGKNQKHTLVGQRMLSRIRLWSDLAPIVHHHHEWFDGSGYPEGLEGEAIPLESRIIAVADAVDAMMRNDTHRAALSLEEVLVELREGAGTQFDSQVVIAMAKLAERGEL
ncbi:MAG: HD domain-containing protein, partial [Deltaproteobacteria bacterium]|nr:HD domain-containing protein [Deltaproteobacteria bacterium]